MSAISRETGKKFAVKMIHRSKFRLKGEESLKMFMREISILESLHHPNICELTEVFEDEAAIRA